MNKTKKAILHAKIAKLLDDYEPQFNLKTYEDLLFWYNRVRTHILNLKEWRNK